MKQSRKLDIYEKNQLLKYSLKESDLLTKGDLPVEYLTGFVNFKGLELKVDQNVLIPRVETEELVDHLVKFTLSLNQQLSYLEVGAGSGAISWAFLNSLLKIKNYHLQIKNFILTDIVQSALKLAKINLQRLFSQKLPIKIDFLESDLLDNLSHKKFNLIVANLPYIPSARIPHLDNSVKDYEPLIALDGGETGFELINKLLEQILDKEFLANGGQIFLEVDSSHDLSFIKNNFPKIIDYFTIQQITDQFARHRFLILQKR